VTTASSSLNTACRSNAVALSRQLQHPAYDCFYLALSRRLDAPLITADKRLHAVLQMGRAVVLGKLVRTLGTFDA
jgi:predicted nucleic acid-binding protein